MKVVAAVLSVVFLVLGILYWKGALQIGASHPGPHHSHGILFLVFAVLALVWMRFQSGGQPNVSRT